MTRTMKWMILRNRTAFILMILAIGVGTPTRSEAGPRDQKVIIQNTLQATTGLPMVHVQLSRGKRILTGEPLFPLFEMENERERSFHAFLDTGSSSYVMSEVTAGRFGVKIQPGAAYHEVGLHGSHVMKVTETYTLALCGAAGLIDEPAPTEFGIVQKEVAWQLNPSKGNSLLDILGGIDIIGMPAIRRLVVEIDPSPMRNTDAENMIGPQVRLHRPSKRPKNVDFTIPLEMIDFNLRNHADNRGSLPELEVNPMIAGIVTTEGASTFSGDWLLDTGASVSIISTKHAIALGLYNADGTPAKVPEFTLPLGGIGGEVKSTPGYVLDTLTVKAKGGKSLEYHNVHVVVQDVGTKTNDGKDIVLDGVFGLNLLLPSVSGVSMLGTVTEKDAGPFDRIWIDGPRGVMGLELR